MIVRNIIVINDFAQPTGGAGKVAFDVAIALAKNGFRVVFFSGTGPESDLLQINNIMSVCLQQPDMLSDSNKVRAALRSIWNHRAHKRLCMLLDDYDTTDTIVMVHGFSKTLSSSIFSSIKKKGVKAIFILHDYFAACPNGGFYNFQTNENCHLVPLSLKCFFCNCDVRSYTQKVYRFIRQLFVCYNLKNSKGIYAFNVSDLSKSKMEPYIGSWFECFGTLYSPIDLNYEKKIDIVNNDTYLFIGRLSEEKGIRDFCKVLTELSLKGIVLGDGYLREELEQKYPNIFFAGWVAGDNKVKYIKQAKCVIFPSKVQETFGLTIAETLSYGLPCIAPKECGASFLIKDGKNGFLYPMNDYDSLKACIRSFEKMGMNSFSKNIEQSFDRNAFSTNTYVNNLIKIFRKI